MKNIRAQIALVEAQIQQDELQLQKYQSLLKERLATPKILWSSVAVSFVAGLFLMKRHTTRRLFSLGNILGKPLLLQSLFKIFKSALRKGEAK